MPSSHARAWLLDGTLVRRHLVVHLGCGSACTVWERYRERRWGTKWRDELLKLERCTILIEGPIGRPVALVRSQSLPKAVLAHDFARSCTKCPRSRSFRSVSRSIARTCGSSSSSSWRYALQAGLRLCDAPLPTRPTGTRTPTCTILWLWVRLRCLHCWCADGAPQATPRRRWTTRGRCTTTIDTAAPTMLSMPCSATPSRCRTW